MATLAVLLATLLAATPQPAHGQTVEVISAAELLAAVEGGARHISITRDVDLTTSPAAELGLNIQAETLSIQVCAPLRCCASAVSAGRCSGQAPRTRSIQVVPLPPLPQNRGLCTVLLK